MFELAEALECNIEEPSEEKSVYYSYIVALRKKFNYWMNNLSIVIERKHNESSKSPVANSSRAVAAAVTSSCFTAR